MKLESKALVSALAAACLIIGAAVASGSAASKVRRTSVSISPDPSTGLTPEQLNVSRRLKEDNQPRAIKHLYIIAPRSGKVILYSTVKGKVTSGSKRLSPGKTRGLHSCGNDTCFDGFTIWSGGTRIRTSEVLGDDGTFGSSVPYVYWWDTRGGYHQHFIAEGQILRISDQPLLVNSVVLNIETEFVPQP